MGGERKYRWERRRERNKSRDDARRFQSFWGFEIILLILIFAFWLIEARLFMIYALVNSPCPEAMASFGSFGSFNIRAFDLMFYKTIVLGAFWLAITFAYWTTLRRSKSGLFHLTLLGCIVFLAVNFRLLQVEKANPPDGSLAILETVVDQSLGEERYAPLMTNGDKFGAWHFGRMTGLSNMSVHYTLQHCVWIDENRIVDANFIPIPGYSDISIDEKIAASEAVLSELGLNEVRWEKTNMLRDIRTLIHQISTDKTALESLEQKQIYRPLLPEERKRFIQKQECLKRNFAKPKREFSCEYNWAIDLDAWNASIPD